MCVGMGISVCASACGWMGIGVCRCVDGYRWVCVSACVCGWMGIGVCVFLLSLSLGWSLLAPLLCFLLGFVFSAEV